MAAGHALEGATKVDAMLIAPATGFAVLFEAKVLADASSSIGFDVLRNQLARNIDVMLQPNPNLEDPLPRRRPERTCFVLLTPEIFRSHPESRLYGWLMRDYRTSPAALQRDLPHRAGTDLAAVASRLGWLTWEDCNEVRPGACPWLSGIPATGWAESDWAGLTGRPCMSFCQDPLVAASYCSTTLAGMRPRSLTAMPWSFAHARMPPLR